MYLNNDVKQWWYFLVSTITIPGTIETFLLAAWSCYSLHDNDSWYWYWFSLRPLEDISITIQICLLEFWSWTWVGVNDDDHWRWYYLRTFRAVPPNINNFFLAIWSRYSMNKNNQQLRNYVTPAIALLSFAVYLFPDIWHWIFMTHDDWRLWCSLRSVIAVLAVIGSLLPRAWSWYEWNDDNQQSCFYRGPNMMELHTIWSFLTGSVCYMTNYNQHRRYHLGIVIALLPWMGAFTFAFSIWYDANDNNLWWWYYL